MNANGMDYSYSQLDLPFKKVLEGLLTKAVRVTTAVKDKIKKGYQKNFTVAGIEQQQVELVSKMVEQVKTEAPKPVESVQTAEVKPAETVSTVAEEDYLVSKSVDETRENLSVLYDKLIQLQNQKNVIMIIKRVALYTKELAKLTSNVTKKWFADFVKQENTTPVAVGQIVMPEMSIPSITQPTPTQTPMPVATPTIIPTVEPTPTPVPNVETVPTVKSLNWEALLDSVRPKVEAVVAEPEEKANEMPINSVNEFKFEMPTFGQRTETQTVSAELPGVVQNVEAPKSNVLTFERPKDSSLSIDKKDGFPTRGEVTARLYRLGETIREQAARIAKLNAELEAIKAEKAEANKKVGAYERVNNDLSSKIISLTEQLSSANSDLENAKAMRAQLMKSHEEEIAQMKADFDLSMAKASEDKASLIASYESRLAANESKYRADLAKLNADYKNTMQTIYADMQNIQGMDDTSMSRTEPQDNAYDVNTVYSYEEPGMRMVA